MAAEPIDVDGDEFGLWWSHAGSATLSSKNTWNCLGGLPRMAN